MNFSFRSWSIIFSWKIGGWRSILDFGTKQLYFDIFGINCGYQLIISNLNSFIMDILQQ